MLRTGHFDHKINITFTVLNGLIWFYPVDSRGQSPINCKIIFYYQPSSLKSMAALRTGQILGAILPKMGTLWKIHDYLGKLYKLSIDVN